jgi:hypothetical protein
VEIEEDAGLDSNKMYNEANIPGYFCGACKLNKGNLKGFVELNLYVKHMALFHKR